MNISLAKYKDLPLKVTYYTKKRHLGTKIFFANSKFQDVLLYFEKNLKDSRTFLKSCYFLNGKQIFPNDILLYYCTVDPHLRLVEEDLFIEIEELELIDDSSEPAFQKLLKPVINPFKLIILNIKEGVLQMVDFPKDKIKQFGFDGLINNNYACCNSLDALFISFGKNFWIISNKNFAIEKREMPISKEKHSMNYILSNNTVFIAGGNSDDSFYYDIKTKQFIPWGKMNGIQEKPALIQYGEYLYSFNSFNSSGIYFERTKLTSPTKKWEKLIPQSGDQESGFFYNQLYGVSKCSGGNILFAGGVNNQLRTFVYNLNLNVLYININKDESVLLNERTFYKIDQNFNIAITQNIEKDHIIGIVNKNAKSLNLLPFEQIGMKTRNKILQYDNPRNRLPGNLVVQCRYMSIKDYENFLKEKSGLNNKLISIASNNGIQNNENIKSQQLRNKTPLSLERIVEGKSDEESDEDEFSRKKSSSAKREKSKFELDLNDENVPKLNLFTKKLDKSNDKNETKTENSDNKEKENKSIRNHSDLEPEEMDNQNISNTELKHKINNNNMINRKKEKEEGETSKINKGLENNKQISKNGNLINPINEENAKTKNKIDSKKDIKNDKDNAINNDGTKNININKNDIKIESKEKITKINTNATNAHKANPIKKTTDNNSIKKIETVNTQHQNINITHNTNNINEQNKVVIIQKSNTNVNTNNNSHQKSYSNHITESKKNNNPFIDNDKYQNIVEKESIHIKEQIEPNINKIVSSAKTKTMTAVNQKRQNVIKQPLTISTEERIQTDPNTNSNNSIPNRSRTNRQSKGKKNPEEHKEIKKTNSFRVKLNVNQEPKKGPKTQRTKLNINLNNSTPSLTEGNKIENNINKTQINSNQKGIISSTSNNNSVNNNNIGVKITKMGNNTQNEIYNIKNNEMNKEGKRYVLTRNVQRIRKEDDVKRKNINDNEAIK